MRTRKKYGGANSLENGEIQRAPKATATAKRRTKGRTITRKKNTKVINEATWKEYLESAEVGIQLKKPVEYYYYTGLNIDVPKVILLQQTPDGIVHYTNPLIIDRIQSYELPTEVKNELVLIPNEFLGYVNNTLITKQILTKFEVKNLSEEELKKEIMYIKPIYTTQDPIYTTQFCIDILNEKLGMHTVYLNKLSYVINPAEVVPVNPQPLESKYSSIRDLFINPKDGSIIHNAYYTIYRDYAFLRNLIDFLHDYTAYGVQYIDPLIQLYTAKNQDYNSKLLNKWTTVIQNTIVTKSGKVSQKTCHKVTKELIEEYCTFFAGVDGMKWIIPKKEDGRIMDAKLIDEASVRALLSKINTNGTEGLYIESINSNIDILFRISPSYAINYIDIKSGDWDGGSGYGFPKAEKARQFYQGEKQEIPLKKVDIQRYKNRNSVVKLPHHDQRNISEGMFGIFDIHLQQNTLTISGPNITPIKMVGPQKLSINAIAKLLGEHNIRGEEGGSTHILRTNRSADHAYTPYEKLAILTLKQWTDTIQTLDSLQQYNRDITPRTSRKYYIGVVYNDILAEMAGQFEGAKCSILNSKQSLQYYSYDKRALVVPPPILREKQLTLIQVSHNKEFLMSYLEQWFNDKIRIVKAISNKTSDPAIFFPSILMLSDLEELKTKAMNELSSITMDDYTKYDKLFLFPTTVEEYITKITQNKQVLLDFNNEFCIYNKIIYDIPRLNLRNLKSGIEEDIYERQIKNKNFYDFYDSEVKQKMVDSLIKRGIENFNPYISAIFAYGFFNKSEAPGGSDICEEIPKSSINKALAEGFYTGENTPEKRSEARKEGIRLGMNRYINHVLDSFATIKSKILLLTKGEQDEYKNKIRFSLDSDFSVYKINFTTFATQIISEKGIILTDKDKDLLEIYLEIEKAVQLRSRVWTPDNENASETPFITFIQ